MSRKACEGILRRAERRGRRLPEPLRSALLRQLGASGENIGAREPITVTRALTARIGTSGPDLTDAEGGFITAQPQSLAFNQRDEPRMADVAYSLQASPGVDEQLVIAPNTDRNVYVVYPEPNNSLRARPIGEGPTEAIVSQINRRSDRGTIVVDPARDPIAEIVGRHVRAALNQATELVTFRKSRRAQSTEDVETWVPDDVTNTLTPFDVGDVRATSAVVEAFYESGPGFVKQTEVSGVLAARDFKGSSTSVVHDMRVRRLTPDECQRLQGFPSDWNAEGIDESGKDVVLSDSQRYKQAGNAVTVDVAEWIANRLLPVVQS